MLSDSDEEPSRPTAAVEGHILHRAIDAKRFQDSETIRKDVLQFYEDLAHSDGHAIGALWAGRAGEIVNRCKIAANDSRRRRSSLHLSGARVLQHSGTGGINTVALDQELAKIGYPDLIGCQLEKGLPIAGELPVTGLWDAARSKEQMQTVQELRQRGLDLKALKERCNAAIEDEVAVEIWWQTKIEVGTNLGKPRPFDWGSAGVTHRVLSFRFGGGAVNVKRWHQDSMYR